MHSHYCNIPSHTFTKDNAAKSAQFGADQLNFFRSVLVLLRHSVSFGFFKIPVLEASFLPRFSAILQVTLPTGTGTCYVY
jgi:hypothetical protein